MTERNLCKQENCGFNLYLYSASTISANVAVGMGETSNGMFVPKGRSKTFGGAMDGLRRLLFWDKPQVPDFSL